jgi:hypothetical protein
MPVNNNQPPQTTAEGMSDRDIAIAHMALYDAKDSQSAIQGREHWGKHFDTMIQEVHSGDCTKQPWSCPRCITEEALKMVPAYRALFGIKQR